MQVGEMVSLSGYFLLMMGIGVYAFRKSTADMSEYMLGGRQLSPAVASLSAGASDMSGWMLLGLPGAMYVSGLSAAWIAVGLVVGAFFNYLWVAPRLRVYTEVADDAITLPDFFEKRFADDGGRLRLLSSLVIVIFFTLYTSAGVVAGGKLFEASMGVDYELGLFITAGVVVAYTLFGGFLAVSLTDFVQGCIMFVALILVPVVTLTDAGGLDAVTVALNDTDATLLSAFGGLTALGLLSSVSWGLGYFGQPHIIVRFMALRSHEDAPTARRIGMSWMTVSLCGAVATGLIGFAWVQRTGTALEDPETIFIFLSQVLFHPLIAGFLLAAILAAIMSTISSQLLVSSASLTEDFYRNFLRAEASQRELVAVGRVCVLLVALIAIALAFDRSSTILSLVSNAWAGFGAAFGPIVLLSLYWRGLTRNGALAGMLTGALTVLFWVYAPITVAGLALSALVYEIVPGFVLASLASVVVSRLGSAPRPLTLDQYDRMLTIIHGR